MFLFGFKSLSLKAYSKINLSLHIKGIREDGYHLLDSVVLPTTIHDVVEVTIDPNARQTMIVCDEPIIQRNHHNLCQFAVEKMRERFNFKENFSISIHKDIPVSAGLGGGSSDAAAVILAINKLLKLNASKEDLIKIALSIGADVPFFLSPTPSRLTGIGETLEPIEVKNDYYILLLVPEKGLSTKEVYSSCKDVDEEGSSDLLIDALAKGDDETISKEIKNDLYPASLTLYPELEEYMNLLKKLNFEMVSMTGSGSSLFALSRDKKTIEKAECILTEEGYLVKVGKIGILKH